MNRDPKKLLVIITWLGLICLIELAGLVYLTIEGTLKESLLSGLTNFVTTIITVLFLYYVFKKRIEFNESENNVEELKNVVNSQTDEIDSKLIELQEKVKTVVDDQTSEIGSRLSEVSEKVKSILEIKQSSSWDDFFVPLRSLRGDWLEFIPNRVTQDIELSIASFRRDKNDRHEFVGNNYNTQSGEIHYKFETQKILQPIRVNENLIYIYYIYKRSGGPDYDNKYGFGKLEAYRRHQNEEIYDFRNGFFYNESNGGKTGFFPMILIKKETIEDLLKRKIDASDTGSLKELFAEIKSLNIYDEWTKQLPKGSMEEAQ